MMAHLRIVPVALLHQDATLPFWGLPTTFVVIQKLARKKLKRIFLHPMVELLTCENSHGTLSHRALPRLYDRLCSIFRAPARIQKDAHSLSRIFLATSTKKENLTNLLNKRHLRTSRIYHLHSAKQFISEHISLSFTPSSDPGGFSSARKGVTITHQQVETQRHNTCGFICTLRK